MKCKRRRVRKVHQSRMSLFYKENCSQSDESHHILWWDTGDKFDYNQIGKCWLSQYSSIWSCFAHVWQVTFLAEVELNLQLQPPMQTSPSLATDLQFFICLLEIKKKIFRNKCWCISRLPKKMPRASNLEYCRNVFCNTAVYM